MSANGHRRPGVGETQESDAWLTVPNALTIFRICTIVPFVSLAANGRDAEALFVFFLAGLTDTLDGTIARRFGQSSRLGRFLDPMADKLLTGAAFLVLSMVRAGFRSIPVWVTASVIMRDVLILGGSLVIYALRGRSDFKPTASGKINTFIEIGVVVIFLGASSIGWLADLLPFLYAILVLSILVSAGAYVRVGIKMLRSMPDCARP